MQQPNTRPCSAAASGRFGAIVEDDGVQFNVWAPESAEVVVLLDGGGSHALERGPSGVFSARVPGIGAGTRYRIAVDGQGPYPDPASRFQPDGVHGASEVIDPSSFTWTCDGWRGVAPEALVLYELHVGTFSPEGTFAAAIERLPYLAELGVTVLELMPVADFDGNRNWGYDGVSLFAPARCYGRPDDLRRLVDAAHVHGLAVFLDVVYNHLGPAGAYLPAVSPQFFSNRHDSPWGAGVNLDGPGGEGVRAILIHNALHWIREYRIDGLRLDATHALVDESARHFLEELTTAVHGAAGSTRPLVVAEDHRNLAIMLREPSACGWGLDGVWADDFHHQMRRLLTGDHEGYFEDFTGTTTDLAATIDAGWFFTGQHSKHLEEARGTEPDGLPLRKFVICLQNHDQIGNRALGDRLHHAIEPAAYRAATAVLLMAPETPLLFMGQEWAATSPFLYFTDHEPSLGALVTEGRRREFRHFAAFSDESARERIPDPQAGETFERSRLPWSELTQPGHREIVALYRRLLALRRQFDAAPAMSRGPETLTRALDDDSIAVLRLGRDGRRLLLVARLRGAGSVTIDTAKVAAHWTIVLTTEDAEFAVDPAATRVDATPDSVGIHFARPSAVILEAR